MISEVKIFIAIVVVAIPLVALLRNNHKFVIWWICVTIGLDILAIRISGIVLPFEVVGLIYLPGAFVKARDTIATRTGFAYAGYLVHLIALGILFGYVIPWPDLTAERPWIQQAGGRSVSYLVTTAAYTSVMVYVGVQVAKGFSPSTILRYIIHGTTIVSASVLAQFIAGVDFFGLIALGHQQNLDRLRGFTGEPRYAGLVIVTGLALLIATHTPVRYRGFAIGCHLVAFALAASASATVALMAGLATIVLSSSIGRGRVMTFGTIFTGFALVSWGILSKVTGFWWSNLVGKVFTVDPHAPAVSSFRDQLVSRLEVFDASALDFLLDNPLYAIIGTGPGLVSIPASAFIPPGYSVLVYGDRIDNPPLMGIVLILSNVGLFGFALLVAVYVAARNDLLTSATSEAQHLVIHVWNDARVALLIVTVLYLVQANQFIYLLLGIGIGAGMITRSERKGSVGVPIQRRT